MCVSPFSPRSLFTIVNIQPLPNGLLPKTHKANCRVHTNLYVFFSPFDPERRPPRILAVNAGLYNDDNEVFDGYENWEVSNFNGRRERGACDLRAPGAYMQLFVL